MSRIAVNPMWAGCLAFLESGPKSTKEIEARFHKIGFKRPANLLYAMSIAGMVQGNGKRLSKSRWAGTNEGFAQLDLVRELIKPTE